MRLLLSGQFPKRLQYITSCHCVESEKMDGGISGFLETLACFRLAFTILARTPVEIVVGQDPQKSKAVVYSGDREHPIRRMPNTCCGEIGHFPNEKSCWNDLMFNGSPSPSSTDIT